MIAGCLAPSEKELKHAAVISPKENLHRRAKCATARFKNSPGESRKTHLKTDVETLAGKMSHSLLPFFKAA